MRIYLQWATATAEDWFPIEVTSETDVLALPKKGVPQGEGIDDEPGWLCALNCQGITFSGYDHTAIEVVGDSLRITGWMDDPEDWGDARWANSWLLSPPAPDPQLGGVINTVQALTNYATPDVNFLPARPWDEFVHPPAALTLHGRWLPDELFLAHANARSERVWREWVS